MRKCLKNVREEYHLERTAYRIENIEILIPHTCSHHQLHPTGFIDSKFNSTPSSAEPKNWAFSLSSVFTHPFHEVKCQVLIQGLIDLTPYISYLGIRGEDFEIENQRIFDLSSNRTWHIFFSCILIIGNTEDWKSEASPTPPLALERSTCEYNDVFSAGKTWLSINISNCGELLRQKYHDSSSYWTTPESNALLRKETNALGCFMVPRAVKLFLPDTKLWHNVVNPGLLRFYKTKF